MHFTRIIPLDRYNWEACLSIQLPPEQEQFTPPVLYSLAQAKFENLFPFGIEYDDQIVGMLMYGQFGGICWISRIMVDLEFQRQGIGTAAMKQLIDQLKMKLDCKEIRTSYARENYLAADFFEALGFIPMEDSLKDEIVATYKPVI